MIPASLLLVTLLVSSEGGEALAADGATARLEVRAAPDCVTRVDLVTRVAARSPRIRFIDGGGALAIRADFTGARAGLVVGELVLTQAGGKPSSRRLVARSCSEAADAIALIIAVTLDPASALDGGGAVGGADDEGAVEAAAGPTAGASARSPGSSPAGNVAREPAKEAVAPPEQARATVVLERPGPAAVETPIAATRRLGAQLAGQMIFGPAPQGMAGVSGYAIAGLDRASLWSPAIVVGVTHVWRNGLAELGGTASFVLDAATLDACAIRLQVSVLEARACGTFLAGRLAAKGSETYSPASVARPFAAAGAAVLLHVGLGSLVELSARVGAGGSLIRDSFEFAPDVFHRAAPLTLAASIGAGLRIP